MVIYVEIGVGGALIGSEPLGTCLLMSNSYNFFIFNESYLKTGVGGDLTGSEPLGTCLLISNS